MRGIWCVSLLLIGGVLLSTRLSQAHNGLQVDETAVRLFFDSEKAEVHLAVRNPSAKSLKVAIKLELLNVMNRADRSVEKEITLDPGSNIVTVTFDLSPNMYVLWRRLRYQVIALPDAGITAPSVSGIISLSQICPDMFQLNLLKPSFAASGTRYLFRVRAEHPVTRKPVEAVRLHAEITFEGGEPTVTSESLTDSQGQATFEVVLPRDIKTNGEIKVSGTRKGLSVEVEGDIRFDRYVRISVSTDKSIYQPGQTIHTRILALEPSMRALKAAELTLKITDPEDTVVHRASLKTSRFGVASDDWSIPPNTRLGDYRIKFDRDEDDPEDVYSPDYKIRVSRYELPNFTVSAKPDRGFYLPDQNAEIQIRADYLFGQPVTRGRVRVVRETSRDWNYREQKWEIEENESCEGELDQAGSFVAHLNLTEKHNELAGRDYSRFEDVTYTAYVTDLTTNKTEQRRVALRVSKEPIHIYLIDDGDKVLGQPMNLYVSTCYADGTPAQCEIKVSQSLSDSGSDTRVTRTRPLRTINTNRYGVARCAGIVLKADHHGTLKNRGFGQLEVALVARDRDGRTGHTTRTIWSQSTNLIYVATNKTLYKPGEPIDVEVSATSRPSRLLIDVTQGFRLIHSQVVSLVNGHGRFTLPYRKEFQDDVTIAAYVYERGKNFDSGVREVLFPRRHELKLNLNMSQQQYRPGEQASATFQIQTGSGQPTESALGIAVIDRAVEERSRTDADFGGKYDYSRAFSALRGYDEGIAGITRRELENLDLSKRIPDDLQLVAEIMFRRRGYWLDQSESYDGSARQEFSRLLDLQLTPIRRALDSRYQRRNQYPTNSSMLERELADFGLDFSEMRDPWGIPYFPQFTVNDDRLYLRIMSAGPDKRAHTYDDFEAISFSWPYFKPVGDAIDSAVREYHGRTDAFIRDRRVLKRELLTRGLNIDDLRDKWGKPYRFEFGISENDFTVVVKSGGPDRRFGLGRNHDDDFTLWTSKINYFEPLRRKIESALTNYFRDTNNFPQNNSEFSDALNRVSIDQDSLRDPWGDHYYPSFKTHSRYADRVTMISYAQYLREARQRTEITPVTQLINYIHLRSAGQDHKEGTSDDFDAAIYSRVVSERSASDQQPRPPLVAPIHSGATGAIAGRITDPNGAVISGAKVKATHKFFEKTFEGQTDNDGYFLVPNLPAGAYEVRIEASGFMARMIVDVPVNSSTVTELNATLDVGVVTETVTVTGSVETVQTQSLSLNKADKATTTPLTSVKQLTQSSTPRLREYFPETLLWQPSLETDKNGLARLTFQLADNITTWKMSVIASTEDGEVGTAEKEILAFQPFFIEHEPPRVLTEGDEISLPVVVRNYLDKTQTVELEMKREPWFELRGSSRKRSEVAAGDASRTTFDVKAVSSVSDGKQRVSAIGSDQSDAVEKPVSVHPDGQELTQTVSQVFSDAASMDVAVPEAAIPGSARTELKLYPNLMSHVIESVEAIMRRPYGCAEQTISSAYPSVLLLKHLRSPEERSSALAQKALRYIASAYEKLRNYQGEDGGFTYWGRGESDPALTAYAVRFLTDLRELMTIDEQAIGSALEWLIKHQRVDGSWVPRYNTEAERLPVASLTAYVARVLASTYENGIKAVQTAPALRRALSLLRQRVNEIDDPHLIASYALAAMKFGDKAEAARCTLRLRSLSVEEGTGSYWKLETNTPFCGWGIAGRIEATAVVVQALALADETDLSQPQTGSQPRNNRELINRGLFFLLRAKDYEGVWYSTQATVNVLDSLMSVLDNRKPSEQKQPSPAEIFVNDKLVVTIQMPAGRIPAEPILTDISSFFTSGINRVKIRRPTGSPESSVQIIESHYERWRERSNESTRALTKAEALRLKVMFDKQEAKIGEEISCTVQTERIAFRGYGMLLAEIGLPPGADVDRATLERAMKEAAWSIDQYDVLPDRLIVYLWPRAGGTQFQFKFRVRFGLVAQTAPSLVYDYYNPEAKAIVAPKRFIVR